MKTASVLILGSIPAPTVEKILRSLPTGRATWTAADITPAWTNKDGSKNKNATAQRNAIAAMTCAAVVVCKGARYFHSAVKAMRHRGRSVYFYDGTRLHDVDAMNRRDKGGFIPSDAQREEDLWADQLRERRAAMDEAIAAQAATMERLKMYASRLACEAYAYTQTAPKANTPGAIRWKAEFTAIRAEHIRATSTLETYDRENRRRERRARLLWNKQAEALCDLPSTEDALHPKHRAEGITDFDRAELQHRLTAGCRHISRAKGAE